MILGALVNARGRAPVQEVVVVDDLAIEVGGAQVGGVLSVELVLSGPHESVAQRTLPHPNWTCKQWTNLIKPQTLSIV